MNGRRTVTAGRAEEMRLAFDRSFAAAPDAASAATEDILSIRMGEARCALRIAEIRGVFADKKVTRIPGRSPALLGIAGFRGTIVPVYALSALLGYPPGETMRWVAVAAAAPVAVAFEEFAGHLRVAADAIAPHSVDAEARQHVRGYVRADGGVWGIVDLPAVVAAIARGASPVVS